MARRSLSVYYTGRVQGVGFRYTVKQVASGFEVCGRVQNLSDGRVLLQAEGSEEELTAFLQAIRESEVGRFVKSEQSSWGEAKIQYTGFEIVR